MKAIIVSILAGVLAGYVLGDTIPSQNALATWFPDCSKGGTGTSAFDCSKEPTKAACKYCCQVHCEPAWRCKESCDSKWAIVDPEPPIGA